MAGEVAGGAAFHAFVISGADKAGEALAARLDGGVNHGPKLRL